MPLVLSRPVANREVVLFTNAAARALGIKAGLTLAEAQGLCPALAHGHYDPQRDYKALLGLARWMMRFTPVVALNGGEEAENFPVEIFLDVTGCEQLFGGMDKLYDQVAAALARFGISAGLAVAPTPGAAWAAAFGSPDSKPPLRAILSQDNLSAALAPLPLEGLRLESGLAATLRHLGMTTIGQVMALGRHTLPSRFGPQLLLRLDQALGQVAEPLHPLADLCPIEAQMDFDGVVHSIEALWGVLQHLITKLAGELLGRGCGARRVEVVFLRPDAPALTKTILLSCPTRDAAILFNLVRCAMETLGLPEEKQIAKPSAAQRHTQRIIPEGFTGLRMSVPLFQPVNDQQIYLLDHEENAGAMELARLIERLRIRLGENIVVQESLVESHVPERACRSEEPRISGAQPAFAVALPPRPLHLLRPPVEIGVMVCPSDDRDGRPISFTHDRQVYPVAHAIGPERICGEWWRGHDKTRDYFDVADATGRRFWLFRVAQTRKWYLHGMFAAWLLSMRLVYV